MGKFYKVESDPYLNDSSQGFPKPKNKIPFNKRPKKNTIDAIDHNLL